MSGTSLDGVDLVYLNFSTNGQWNYKVIAAETVPYTYIWEEKLRMLTQLDLEDIQKLDVDYTKLLGEVINDFVERNSIKNLDFVSSHGHTALHQPEKNLTYQIGNLPIIATITNSTLICNFRKQDVELGGQGAPLVPIGDKLLFGEFEYCLNLGGFANLSTERDQERIAYDVCPVNIVLNSLSEQVGKPYDEKGSMARSGNSDSVTLEKLNSLKYYTSDFPKSLGLEWVNENVFPILHESGLRVPDALRTFVEHMAMQIGKNLSGPGNMKVLITGGGAYNEFLIERMKLYFHGNIVIPNREVIEFKEAIIFALLGILKFRGEINCLKSVTGAKRDHSSGIIHYPKNNLSNP